MNKSKNKGDDNDRTAKPKDAASKKAGNKEMKGTGKSEKRESKDGAVLGKINDDNQKATR